MDSSDHLFIEDLRTEASALEHLVIILMKYILFAALVSVAGGAQSGPAQSSPAPVQANPSVPQEDANAAKARLLIQQCIQALGGQGYLTVKDAEQAGRTYGFYHGQPSGTGTVFWRFTKFPDKDRIEFTKQRDVIYIYNGDQGFEVTFRGTRPQDPADLADFLQRREHSLDKVLRGWLNEPGLALFYDGHAIAEQKQVEQVTIMNARNDAVSLFLDSNTHLPVKKSYSLRDPKSRERDEEVEIFDNYRPVQGIMTPHSITRYKNGDMVNQRFITRAAYNQNPPDSLFNAVSGGAPAKPVKH